MRITSPTEAIQIIVREQNMSEWVDKEAPLYQATLSDFPIQFALGKHQTDPKDGTFFFLPIYAFSRGKIRYAIGYYRIKQVDFPDAVLDDGCIDMKKLGEPRFFKKIGKKQLPFGLKFIADHLDMAKQGKKPAPQLKSDIFDEEKDTQNKDQEKNKDHEEEEEEEEEGTASLFHIKAKPATKEEALFDKKAKKLLPPLAEETEESMEKQQAAFRKDPPKDASWIARFMMDDRYTLEPPQSLLECIVEALEDQGWTTTVDKLQLAMSNQTTTAQFQEEKATYLALRTAESQTLEDKAILTQRQQTIRKNLALPTLSEVDRETLTEEKERIDKIQSTHTDQEKQFQEAIERWVPEMSESATVESYRNSIRHGKHPLDTLLLGLLERVLQMKLILFLAPALPDAPDFVINLVPPLTAELMTPRFFVLVSMHSEKDKDTIQLIRFQSRGILEYKELPYAVRARLQTRALEDPQHHALSGLPEFPEEPSPGIPVHDVSRPTSDPDVRFVVGPQAPPQHPLLSLFLDIERYNKAVFLPLQKLPSDWRRRLSDEDMVAKFQLDGHTWHSVFHYLHAQPYKEKASVYIKWTAGQEYSKEPGQQSIKKAKKAAKELGATPLPDQEREQARAKAWEAKRQQNEDVRRILRATQNATLLQFKRGKPVEPDLFLMRLREGPN
jgi:chemotaxis protein histidine kinase CheA